MSDDFIGRGWAFPIRADATGGIALVSREQELAESIRLILGTAKGERPMRPEFGCGIHDEVFSPMDATTAGRVAYDVRAALERWEPRIDVTAVDVTYREGARGRHVRRHHLLRTGDQRPPQPGLPLLHHPRRRGALMPLPVPNLDDRRFQDLVDDAKRLVQQRCPDWTDHNVSDPGVTLIETFAFMVDQLLYRLNRVPDRNYVKFLDLFGVRLFPPVAARAPVTFWLSAPQPEAVRIAAGSEVATVRTEVEEAVVFTVDADLDIVPCSLQAAAQPTPGGVFRDHSESLQGGPGAPCFWPVPQPGDALYVGLSDPVPRCAVALRFKCRIEGVGVDPLDPPLRWEAYDGNDWARCELERDDTGGLNRAGDMIVHVPAEPRRQRGGPGASRLAAGRRNRGPTGQPCTRRRPGSTTWTRSRSGGRPTASHAKTVERETLGTSSGAPGQRLKRQGGTGAGRRRRTPCSRSATARDGRNGAEVEGFADSALLDKHFVFDRRTGEVAFGPAVRFERWLGAPVRGRAAQRRRRCGCARTAPAVAAGATWPGAPSPSPGRPSVMSAPGDQPARGIGRRGRRDARRSQGARARSRCAPATGP